MRNFIEKLESIRALCSAPSRVPGKGRLALKGMAPANHIADVGLSLEEICRWCGGSTEVTPDSLEAVAVLLGEQPATFGKTVWASHKLERIAFETELKALDEKHGRGDKTPVGKMRDGALRSEVVARRIGLLRAIEKMGGKVDSDATSAELIAALGKAAERARTRKQATENREAFGRFRSAQISKAPGVPRNFADFPAYEARKRAERRREKQGPPAPQAVVTTVEATGDGETKVVQTKVRAAAQVTKRRPAQAQQAN